MIWIYANHENSNPEGVFYNHKSLWWILAVLDPGLPGIAWWFGIPTHGSVLVISSADTDVGISGSVFHISCLLISTGHIGYATPHPSSYMPTPIWSSVWSPSPMALWPYDDPWISSMEIHRKKNLWLWHSQFAMVFRWPNRFIDGWPNLKMVMIFPVRKLWMS